MSSRSCSAFAQAKQLDLIIEMSFHEGESEKVGKNASVPNKKSITYSDALVVSYLRLVDVRQIKTGFMLQLLGLKWSK